MADTRSLYTAASALREKSASWLSALRATKRWQRAVRLTLSYGVLVFGSMLMLFPMLWMISASLKPPWQIFSTPINWIPQKWEDARAGNTNQTVNLWTVQHDGQEQKVISVGTRRYTTVIDVAKLQNLKAVPPDQIGKAVSTTIDVNNDSVTLNLRPWTVGGATKQAVALAKSGDNTVIVTLDDVRTAVSRLPLDVVNSGDRDSFTVGDIELKGRTVNEGGVKRQLFPVGPESELTVVSPPTSLTQVGFVSADQSTDG